MKQPPDPKKPKAEKPPLWTNAAPPTLGSVFGDMSGIKRKLDEAAAEKAAAARRAADRAADGGFKPLKGAP